MDKNEDNTNENLQIDKIASPIEFYYFIEVMKKCTNENHILSESDISYHIEKLVSKDLGIQIKEIDRRKIYKYSEMMKYINYDVSIYKENKKGYFLRNRPYTDDSNYKYKYRDFEPKEIEILIASLLTNKFITKIQRNSLKKRLQDMKMIYSSFDSLKYISNKEISLVDKVDIYHSITVILDAIKNGKKVSYDLYKMGYDKKFIKEDKKGTISKREVNPIGIVFKNDRYYFIFISIENEECKIKNNRLDRIRNLAISINDMDEFSEYDNYKETLSKCSKKRGKEIDVDLYAKKHLKMYSGDNYDTVKLKVDDYVVGYIIEELGVDYDIDVELIDEELSNKRKYIVKFESAITGGLAKWLLALDSQVEVIEPIELRSEMIKKISKLSEIYNLKQNCINLN